MPDAPSTAIARHNAIINDSDTRTPEKTDIHFEIIGVYRNISDEARRALMTLLKYPHENKINAGKLDQQLRRQEHKIDAELLQAIQEAGLIDFIRLKTNAPNLKEKGNALYHERMSKLGKEKQNSMLFIGFLFASALATAGLMHYSEVEMDQLRITLCAIGVFSIIAFSIYEARSMRNKINELTNSERIEQDAIKQLANEHLLTENTEV